MIEISIDKLVRDNLPKKVTEVKVMVKTMNKKRFRLELIKKLSEASDKLYELIFKQTINQKANKEEQTEQIADIFEALDYIIKSNGLNIEKIKAVQKEKRISEGGFDRRIYLLPANEITYKKSFGFRIKHKKREEESSILEPFGGKKLK